MPRTHPPFSYSLIADDWLSGMLERSSFRLQSDETNPHDLSHPLEPTDIRKLQAPAFVYAKADCKDTNLITNLSALDFQLIETSLLFDATSLTHIECQGPELRFATPSDENRCCEIAEQSFLYSRFHSDQQIPRNLANGIKREWTRNYFAGKRGTHMVVTEDQKQVAGFLLLIMKGGELTIDLIGVSENSRRKGIAQRMIGFAAQNIAGWRTYIVGTQASNIASVRLYESLGFRLRAASYTFHWHTESLFMT